MNIYGVRGYPTPDFTDERHCRTFSIPDTTIALAVFMGALWQLTDEKMWQQYGDMTPAEAADMMTDVIWAAYANDYGICEVVEAPYWDTYDDADDTSDPSIQPWYGQIVALPSLRADPELTFLDNLGIWLVAGFIAYAGLPGAAIAFVPVARRFVLFFKSSPTGAIVNILADFLHIADIDTYGVEDKIMTVLVTMPDDATTLYVQQADESNPLAGDNPQIMVVRSELSEANFAPPNYRYNSDCDCVQYSPDGGTTWNDAPNSDPRHADPFRLPPRGGSDIDCNASANMVAWIKGVIDACIHICEVGGIVVAIVNKILEFAEVIFAEEGGVLLVLIQAIAGAVFDIGFTALSAAFTSDQYDLLLCIFFCRIASDGQVSSAKLAAIEGDVTDQLNTIAATVVNLFLALQGEVGLSNAGAQGSATGDCSTCACEHCFTIDLAVDDGSGFGVTILAGAFVLGQGIVGGFFGSENISDAEISWTLPATIACKNASFTYTKNGGSGPNNSNNFTVSLAGTTVAFSGLNPLGAHLTKTIVVDDDIDKYLIDVNSGEDASPVTLEALTITYTGTIPSGWSDNC